MKKLDGPRAERDVWVYFITRSSLGGVLSDKCDLWGRKPTREKHDYRVTWVPTSVDDPGHIGEYTVDTMTLWYRTVPDSDLQMIRAEQYAWHNEG